MKKPVVDVRTVELWTEKIHTRVNARGWRRRENMVALFTFGAVTRCDEVRVSSLQLCLPVPPLSHMFE